MSLTQDDFQQIEAIFERKLSTVSNELKALRNDIKEVYDMISELQSSTITDKEFKRRSLEEKLLTLNAELLATAKQAGVTLPRE
ncbi:MAG: hypothetical protein U5L95_04220 [Candidatus Saccharibacteria bacterium]|nr:hypothetical protein [Candidatus Saccharibacteria bacterium]